MLYVIFRNLFLHVWVMYHFDEPFPQPSILLFFPLLARCFRNLTPRLEHMWLIYKAPSFSLSAQSIGWPLINIMLAPSDHLLDAWLMRGMYHLQGHWLKNLRKKWLPHMNILIPYFAYVSIKDELFHIFIPSQCLTWFPAHTVCLNILYHFWVCNSVWILILPFISCVNHS